MTALVLNAGSAGVCIPIGMATPLSLVFPRIIVKLNIQFVPDRKGSAHDRLCNIEVRKVYPYPSILTTPSRMAYFVSSAMLYFELIHHVPTMSLDGLYAHIEVHGNLLGRHPLGQKLQNLALAGRESWIPMLGNARASCRDTP